MTASTETQLIELTQRLLDAIVQADWKTYAELCDPSLSCFEPEAHGHLIEGMAFHKFYFDLGSPEFPRTTTISSPHVRVMGDVAVVAYVRLTQKLDSQGNPATNAFDETRVWQRIGGHWKHVHFHRSPAPTG